ncbi:glycosyltransferase family protein [Coralliovum pocilloporae]|uniref:glycosyltransferase family protein n=1 Tax=Coralliovum pocilloporae TaxID=3066369 RepID=UPI0033078597
MRVYIHVQHLLGTGHVVRAAALGRALVEAGCQVRLASGNTIPPTVDLTGLDVYLLPKARSADAHFSAILDENDDPISEDWKAARKDNLRSDVLAFQPDILLTETFPFGRRAFRFELLPLLEELNAQANPPLIAASIRDILVRKDDPKKERGMAELFLKHYDLLLVHSDPAFTRLEDSFAATDLISDKLAYTGYIHGASSIPARNEDGSDEILISCGGGAVGLNLLKTALVARQHSKAACDKTWRLLVGKDILDADLAALRTDAHEGLIVERARPDFPALLHRVALSVSQTGYNTALDILAAGCRALFIPFATGDETEQTQRAEALCARGFSHLLPETSLTPVTLASAIDKALAAPVKKAHLDTNGSEKSAEILIRARENQRIQAKG